jgi:hypothetical protein
MNRIKYFFRRTAGERRLALEALCFLAWAKILVQVLPFSRLSTRLGKPQIETPYSITPRDRAIAVEVSWAIQAVARHLPLGFVCLPQAIAAQAMLRRRGLPTTLYFGVAFDQKKKNHLNSHAWLRSGDKIVTGENQIRGHRAIEWFSDEPRRS